MSQAIDLSDDEDYHGAISLLTRSICEDGGSAQAFFERGMALLNLDRDGEAIGDFDSALALNPEFPGARDWRAKTLETLGNHQAAAKDRLKALREKPDGPYEGMGVSPQKWADCAEAFVKAGEPKRATELLEEYFASYSDKVTSYARSETAPMRVFARLLIQSGELERALRFAQRAYASKHQCPVDIAILATALEAIGNLDEARSVCREAMEINSQMPGLRELYGRLSG